MTELPNLRNAVAPAARGFLDVLTEVPADALGYATPCTDFDVEALGNHLLYWAPRLTAAARKQQFVQSAEEEGQPPLSVGPWRERLTAAAEELAAALEESSAWEGTARFASVELPSRMIGVMALCEFVVHGWDFSVATGVEYRCDEAVAEDLERALRVITSQGRRNGVFGAEVPVSAHAPVLQRVLGLTGRDPCWGAGSR